MLGKYVVKSFSDFYAYLFSAVATTMIIIFLNFESENKNACYGEKEFSNFIQESNDKLCHNIYFILREAFNMLIDNDEFTEKNRNNIFSNLYAGLIAIYSIPYNEIFNSLDKNEFDFLMASKKFANATE